MGKIKTIKVKITSISTDRLWYQEINKTIKCFNKPFLDDDNILSLWEATVPTKFYVYIKDTNYNKAIRKKKLKKINSYP